MAANVYSFIASGNYDASTGLVGNVAGDSLTYASAYASAQAVPTGAIFNISYSGTSSWKFIGGDHDDSATGGAGADDLTGGKGKDTLDGGVGADTLFGGAGDDVLTGGTGADFFKFGKTDGNDTINGITTGDVVSLYDFNFSDVKTSFASTAADQLTLTYAAGTNTLLVSGYDENLTTFKTQDGISFRVGGSNAAFTYADGIKFVGLTTGGADAATVNASGATAAVTLELANSAKFQSVANATGSDYNDYLRGSSLANVLSGGKGADNLWGGVGGADVLDGGAGADTFWFGKKDGMDTVAAITTGDVINLYDYNYADVKGLFASTAADQLTLTYEAAATTLLVSGYDENWTTFKTQDGINFRVGGSNAAFTYADGIKFVGLTTGGADAATVNASGATAAVTLELANSAKFESVANANGSDYNDYLRGSSLNNVLSGGKGADNLWGGVDGSDVLDGGAGADTFWFGKKDGMDTVAAITTGDVINLYDYNYADVKGLFASTAADQLTLTYAAGTTTLLVSGYDENLTTFKTQDGISFRVGGSNAAFTYADGIKFVGLTTGGADAATVSASGATAAVTLELANSAKFESVANANGSDYNDYLRGSSVNNVLSGGKGADNLWGGAGGSDTLDGGASDNAADTYWFGIGDGTDTIQSYGKGDIVKLYNANFTDVTFGTDGVVKLGAETVTLDTYAAASVNNVTFNTQDGVKFRIGLTATNVAFKYESGIKFVGLVSGDATVASAASVDASTSTAGVTIELADTSRFSKVYTATGSNYNDYLRGSEKADSLVGGAGNDALWGGTGDIADTLTGGIGSDTFWYGVGEGNDVITDGTSLDSVMIYNKGLEVSKVTAATFGSDLKLTFESGTLTVNNWTSAGLNTFNIGGTDYKFDSTTSALVKK